MLQLGAAVAACRAGCAAVPRGGITAPPQLPTPPRSRFQAEGPFWGRQYLFWHNQVRAGLGPGLATQGGH